MFFSHLYLTIYFLSVKTHTRVPFLFLFIVSLGSKLAAVKQNVEIKNCVMLVLINVENSPSDNFVDVWNSQKGGGECCKTNCRAVTTDIWSSRIPERFPSPLSTRCRLCSGKPPSSVWSWWRYSKHQVKPGRIWNSPCGESCWWTCMFLKVGGASAVLLPFLLDMWFLHVGGVKKKHILNHNMLSFSANFRFFFL